MARMMNKDDDLYRVVVTQHREHSDPTFYYGPYTRLSTAKAWGNNLKNRTARWETKPPTVHYERITAGSYSDPVWEEVR